MNDLSMTTLGVPVATFDCSTLSADVRRGVEAMLHPFHTAQLGLNLSQRVVRGKTEALLDVTFRQRASAFRLWFVRKDESTIMVRETVAVDMPAAGLVGD